jgi:adenylate cyclase
MTESRTPAVAAAPTPRATKSTAPEIGQLERQLYRAELLLALSRKVAANDSLDDVLMTLVELTTREIGAERGSIFLNDPSTGELYSRVAQGNVKREIRILNSTGIAGHIFTSGKGEIVVDAYADDRFNTAVDEQTGFVTRNILCVPIRNMKDEVIGAAQILNSLQGDFTADDFELLVAMTGQAAIALESKQFVERVEQTRTKEREFLDIVTDVTSEIDLKVILRRVMSEATRMLQADRSTLFLNDEKTDELFAMVGEGLDTEIRLPNHAGIAGAVFTSGRTVNIPHAYADLRFNPAFDKQTGYFTRAILCVPVISKNGKAVGVTQCLNKRGGAFTDEDEQRLRAFTSQVAIALENAKLFDDIQNVKNYNEGMLESMSNGVITIDDEAMVVTCNAAGQRILKVDAKAILKRPISEVFTGDNAWVVERIKGNEESSQQDVLMDAALKFGVETISVNMTIQPLLSSEGKKLGVMVMLEDISSEKRMKSTMSRYLDPGIANQLLDGGEDILGGKSTVATVLFSDIRGFTPLTEDLGPQGTVRLLNEYFTIMVECISDEGGMLDKFIGDAIMAGFGVPLAHDDDEDRAVRTALAMITKLRAWNTERAKLDKIPVNIGIGLNTDTVVSGNIGSLKRMDYTMIGDGVNLAARLEGACKQYGARILISEFTQAKLKSTYRMRDIDLVVVKGKSQAVQVFEVLDYHDDESFPNLMESLGTFREAITAYRGRRWDVARQAFDECAALNPDDKLPAVYLDRCRQMAENPPADDWDGRWVMTEK